MVYALILGLLSDCEELLRRTRCPGAQSKSSGSRSQSPWERVLVAYFMVWDILRLSGLSEEFDTVLDSSLFRSSRRAPI